MYDAMAFSRKCWAVCDMPLHSRQCVVRSVCVRDTATKAYAALCVTKCSECVLRTWSPAIPALSDINNLHTGPTPCSVSKFVAVPRWLSKRLVAPSARPRQARHQHLITTATTPHPSKPNLVHVPSRRLYIFATDNHMHPGGGRHD